MRVLDSNVEVDPLDVGGNEIYSIVNIKSTPNPKIIQFPLYGSPWRNISNLDPNIVGGLFYPDVKIIDRPPPPPQMLLSPLRSNYQQFLLSFQPSNESFVGDRAIPWMSLSNRDYEHTFLPSILHQKQFKNFALQNKDLEFSSESSGEIKRIEIYLICINKYLKMSISMLVHLIQQEVKPIIFHMNYLMKINFLKR